MSSWDQGEVLKLKSHGNDYARRVWLATAPPVGVGGRPKEGDDINVFKRFVVDVYEHKKYYREDNVAGGVHVASTSAQVVQQPQRSVPAAAIQRQAAPKRVVQSVALVVEPAPAVDLLDFGAFDSAPTSAPSVTSHVSHQHTVSAPAAVAAPSSNDIFDPFNNSPIVTANAHVPAVNSAFANQSFTNATQNTDAAVPSGGDVSFDPFVNFASAPSTTQMSVAKTPVMNTFNANNAMMNNGGVTNNNFHNGMNAVMNNNSNAAMMNGGGIMLNNNNNMMQQSNHFQQQQQIGSKFNTNTMPVQFNNNSNNNVLNGGVPSNNNIMMNGGMVSNSIMQTNQPVMNMNVMQPMSNNISNNFGGTPKSAANDANKKSDPFAGLGF